MAAALGFVSQTPQHPPAPDPGQPALNQSPTNQSPVNQSPVQPQDPAAVLFTSEAGLVFHAVKPGSSNDYEAAMLALKEALSASTDPETQQVASGWRIYKATEADAKSSVIYVHWLDPAVAGVDYRPSLWLDKLLAGAPADLLAKYRDAFAVPPTKLSLTELRPQ
jgi:hypothetical protein